MSDISLIDTPIKRPLTYAVWSEDIIVGRIGIKRVIIITVIKINSLHDLLAGGVILPIFPEK